MVPLFGGGVQPLQTVHVDDVCEAVARIVERGLTGAFNVAEPDPPTLGALPARDGGSARQVACASCRLPFGPVLAAVRTIEAPAAAVPAALGESARA